MAQLAKKGDIEQALALIRAIFMVWAKPLLQVENVELPRKIIKLIEEFSNVFPEELFKGQPFIYGIKH